MKPFVPPDGVQLVRIDRATNLVADESCPNDSLGIAFLTGTAPQTSCSHMGEDAQTLGSRIFGSTGPNRLIPTLPRPPTPSPHPTTDPKHRNFFQKLLGTGKDKLTAPDQPQ